MGAGLWRWGLAMLLGAVAARAAAEDDSVRVLTAHLESLGARVVGEPAQVFLEQGDSRVLREPVKGGCVGFLAFGTGLVRDVDLSLHTEGGLLLDRDTQSAAYAYVRGCAGEPQNWFLSVSMYAGRGKLEILKLADAPRGVGVLPFELGLAAPSGGRPERPRSVGPALPAHTVAERLLAQEPEWLARGYLPVGGLYRLVMASGFARAALPLEEGLCYAVHVSSASSRHTTVILADEGGNRWATAAADAAATVHICPRATGEHSLFVRAQPGASEAFARIYVQPDASRWRPDGEDLDRARVLVGELTHYFGQRGFEAQVVREGWIDTVGPLRWPVALQARTCVGLGAVVLDTVQRGYLELALEAPDGSLVARNRLKDAPPYVWHCAESAGTYRLVVRASGDVGRFALVRADPAAVGGARAAN